MSDLGLPRDSVERRKSVGLWYEGGRLRVRAHLRDAFAEPDGTDLVLHEYRVELVVSLLTMEIESIEVEPVHLPYEECSPAAPNAEALVGERIGSGFGARAKERLAGELGCTHLLSLLGDLSIASLFHGYIGVRQMLRRGVRPNLPPSSERTGICSGWRRGGKLATSMESGNGIAPGRVYPELDREE